jgi:hypothetical protein
MQCAIPVVQQITKGNVTSLDRNVRPATAHHCSEMMSCILLQGNILVLLLNIIGAYFGIRMQDKLELKYGNSWHVILMFHVRFMVGIECKL